MPGWGGYVKPRKTKRQAALERRHELGKIYFTPIDELVSLAATAKVKVKRLPYVPPEDPVTNVLVDPGAPLTEPCQAWVEGHRRWRDAGRPRGKVAPPEPTDRQKKLEATRAWNKARYQKTKTTKPAKESSIRSLNIVRH
jgi:hypothetical protein